ncbi:MAG: sulfite exporter TauE/SafE family protein [Pseudomonadota bacterium]
MTLALVIAALVAGFAGSAHCAGMCGPIVSVFETTGHGNGLDWPRRASYQIGRLLTYLAIGAVVGVIGVAAVRAGAPTQTALVLRTIAALALLLIGLRLSGALNSNVLDRAGQTLWRSVAPLAKHVLPLSTPARALAAGMIWGTLPCGLVYAAAALAIGSGGPLQGAIVMAAFWLGTLPALLAIGGFAQRGLQGPTRRLAGAFSVVMAIGALGMMLMPSHSHSDGTHESAHSVHKSHDSAHMHPKEHIQSSEEPMVNEHEGH